MSEPDLIAEAGDFIAQNPLETARLWHGVWRYLDNKAGNKPVLLLLHGSRGNAYVFWRQFLGLSDDFRMISVGLPINDDAAEICEDLAQLLDQCDVDKVSILGTSIGGYFAQWFTHFHPQRVSTLIISSSIVDGRGFNNPSPVMSRFVIPYLPQSVILRGFRRMETGDPKYAPLVQFLERLVNAKLSPREVAKRASAFHINGAVPSLDLRQDCITVIDCADEPYIDHDAQRRVISRYLGAKHYRLKDGHHFPYIVASEAYNDIVRERALLAC